MKFFLLFLALANLAFAWLPQPDAFPSLENGRGMTGNPALLDPFDGGGYLLGTSLGDKDQQRFQAAFHGEQMGLGFRWDRIDTGVSALDDSRWSLVQSEPLGWGFSSGFRLSYLRTNISDPLWSLEPGLLWRPFSWVSLGWTGENLWSEPQLRRGDHRFGASWRPAGDATISWSAAMAARGGKLTQHQLLLQNRLGCCLEAGLQLPASGSDPFASAVVSVGLTLSPTADLSYVWDGRGGPSMLHAAGHTRWSSRHPGQASFVRLALGSIGEGDRGLVLFGSVPEPLLSLRNQFLHLGTNRRVETVLLDFSGFSGDLAAAAEIRRWTQYLRRQHRRTIAYVNDGDPVTMYAASAADRIVLQPSGSVDVRGFASAQLYWKGLLDSLGIEADVARVGDYKSAVEPFSADSMSPEARRDLQQLLNGLWATWRDTLAASRKIPADSLDSFALHPHSTARWAVARKLADTALYLDQVAEYAGYPAMVEWPRQEDRPYTDSWKQGPVIAIVYAEGEVTGGEGGVDRFRGDASIGLGVLGSQLDMLQKDDDVDAVVLRISSPGGDAGASEALWRKAVNLRNSGKVVIVSIGSMAASGGYYLALAGDEIYAEPTSIVGSIGIFGGKPVFARLAEKWKVRPETVRTHPHADALSSFRKWDSTERAAVEESMQDFYGRFRAAVEESRDLDSAAMDTLGGGRIFTGAQAQGLHLIDKIGGIDDAIARARTLVGADSDSRVILYPIPLQGEGQLPSLGMEANTRRSPIKFIQDMQLLP